jgi:putative ABC transport system permease protein
MQTLWHDVTHAARTLLKSPGFAFPAIVTLALGIGANATVFSLADTVLFRSLPVPDAERIVHVYQRRTQQGPYPLSLPDYGDYRAGARSFESVAAHYPTAPLHALINGDPFALGGAVVTASYFEVLKLQPAAGRFFTAEEDTARDRDAVAVISETLWARQFSRDPAVLGSAIAINGRPFTIVGIAPAGFAGVYPRGIRTDVWIPSAMFGVGYRYCDAFDRGCTIVQMLGRLRAGATAADAQRELDVIAHRLQLTYPATNKDLGVTVVPARGLGRGVTEDRQQMALFLGVVGLVLVIACANIAGLLLARAMGRRKEIAVRVALGAGRARLIRQLLTESLVLAIAGGAAGLVFAFWGNAALDALYASDGAGRPVDFHLTMSGSVVAATAALTIAASMLFGLLPALQASRADVLTVLKDEGASGGGRRARLRQCLVTGQLALSVMMLIATGLLIQSVRHLYAGPGFDPDHVVLARLRPSLVDYPLARAHAYQRDVVRRLESVPGVVSTSPSSYLTIMGAGIRVAVSPRAMDAAHAQRFDAVGGHVGPRYFSTIGLRVLDGREFTDQDAPGAPPAVIVNDVLARKVWPEGRGVGETLMLQGASHLVVGIVPDAQYYAAGESPRAQVFFNYWQSGLADAFLKDSRLHVRVAGDPRAMMATIRREIAAVDPNVPISEDYPLKERVAFAYQPVLIARTVLASFAVLALVLSAVGLYGVLAVLVQQRTREIGIRLALGARRGQVCALVVRDALVMTLAGTAAGVLGAWGASRFLASLMYGVRPMDLVVFVAAPAVLIAVAALASFLPARRAANVSPTTALRYQ